MPNVALAERLEQMLRAGAYEQVVCEIYTLGEPFDDCADRQDVAGRLLHAVSLMTAGAPDVALVILEAASYCAPFTPQLLLALEWYRAGCLFMLAGREAEGVLVLKRTLRLLYSGGVDDRTWLPFVYDLALFEWIDGNLTRAADLLCRAFAVDSNFLDVAYLLRRIEANDPRPPRGPGGGGKPPYAAAMAMPVPYLWQATEAVS